MVKGEDEYSSMSLKAVSMPFSQSPGRVTKGPKASNKSMPLEYSPVRHRSAIERVLSALQGMDPMLDSATKVWTTLAVAKTFNITHSPLEDWIIRWLRAYPNSYFLEVLPEVSHRIAEGLQNYDLARDSFAILVGEEALDSLRHARQPRLHKRTTFGRKKEELPEQIRTRIEYASKSFLERINDDFAYFVANRRMQWIDELPEARRLSSYMQPKIQDIVHKLKDLLKDYVRGAIYKTLCVDYRRVTGPDLHHEGGHDLLPRVDRAIVWANLPLSERILSRNFYEALKSLSMLKGATNLDLINGWHAKGGLDELSHSEKREMARGTYREVKKSDLRALVRNGQTLLDEAQQIPDAHPLPTRLHTLPDRTMDGAQNPKTPWNLLSTQPPDHNLYDAQRDSNIKCLPKRSHALPDRTINGAQDPANNNKASFSAPSQPVDVPKAPKRTQDFPDALSPPNDQQSATEVRTKWPFGAARDDPVAQVLKRVDGLHVSSLYLDRRPATDGAVEDPAGQGREHEGIARGTDPWRGYSDYLDYASETLKHLASKTNLFATNSATEKTPAPTEFSISKDFDDSDVFDEVWQQIEDSRRKESFSTPMFFDLGRFFDQAQEWIEGFASTKLRSSDHELGIVNTLVCLKDSEWKYLELWAGGNDDGSNGVYSDNVPTAEHGFTTAGPEVHDGLTPANSVKASSEFELVSAGDSASTFNASTATNRGFSDTIRRNHVHAVDSLNDSMSDSFTMVTPSIDSDDEETFARKQVAALERVEEAEEAAANEARRMVNGKGNIVEGDESYADLFSGEEEDDDGNDTDRAEFNDEDDNDNEDMVFC